MPYVRSWVGDAAHFFHPLSLSEQCKRMVMLKAYIDDSGSHEQSHACVVPGYFGGVNRWKEFERRWRRVLVEHGIGEFHARFFWRSFRVGHGVGEYRGWSEAQLYAFLDRLLGVIEDTDIYPFACGILRSEWNLLTLRQQKILCGGTPPHLDEASTNPMFFPFQHAITRLIMHCKPGLVMHFFFDENRLTNPWATICYTQLKALAIEEGAPHFAAKMGGLTFDDSRIALPLQAADLLAYEAHRYIKDANGNKKFPIGSVYFRALRRLKSQEDFRLFDRERLDEFFPRFLRNHDTVETDANAKGQTS